MPDLQSFLKKSGNDAKIIEIAAHRFYIGARWQMYGDGLSRKKGVGRSMSFRQRHATFAQ
jgi:hypothetical protein